jgi:hypothetical protein
MRFISLFLLVILIVGMMACGSKPPAGTPEGTLANVPDWYTNPPQDPNYLYAPATAMSKDMQLAVEKAKQQARADLGSQFETRIEGLTKRFDEEIGLNDDSELLSQFTQVSKSIVATTLNGTRVGKQQLLVENNIYRAYVLMELPLGEANLALMQKIKENNNLYTRFRAAQAFDELEKDVERYEQYKKDQGMMK